MPEPVVQRIVPGAPPPAPVSKTQRKKRKAKGKSENGDSPAGVDATSATPIEKISEAGEAQESPSAPDVVAQSESVSTPLPEEDVLLKPSPIVDLVHKRLKATTKKISRIAIYAAKNPETLNDDQIRTVKSLPTLEAIQKELGEVKRAIEVHEAELVQEIAIKRREAEQAEKARIAEAVANAEAAFFSKANGIIDLIRLRASIHNSPPDSLAFATPEELTTVLTYSNALIGDSESDRTTTLKALLSNGDEYSRLFEIVHLAFNPTPIVAEVPQEEDVADPNPALVESVTETEPDTSGAGVGAATNSSSFRFIQASEIEAATFEDEAEWVEKPDAAGHVEDQVNGHHTEEGDAPAPVPIDAPTGTIDWAADDEGGLPSIAGLHAEFGTSGSVTPAEVPVAAQNGTDVAPAVNSDGEHAEQPEDDGFTTQARGGRGRGGRGFRGHHRGGRGGERGAFRGGDRGRGHFRGGERGAHRGGERGERHERGERGERPERGERGERPERGERGEHGNGHFRGYHRGGERGGGFSGRGGSGGEWRGERGGRGRGRGGDRGGAPAAAPPAPNAPAA